MTDTQSTTDSPEKPDDSPAEDDFTPEDFSPKDWMLETLLNIFDEKGSALPITIQSNGATISGVLIGIDEYVEQMGETFAASSVPAMKGATDVWAESLAANATWRADRKERGLPRPARRNIHMRDVRIISGSMFLDFPLWRGSLSDVTGWSLGSINRD